MADQNTSGTPAMTEREASRLDKFKQLLAGPNTDLGKTPPLSAVGSRQIYHDAPLLLSHSLDPLRFLLAPRSLSLRQLRCTF